MTEQRFAGRVAIVTGAGSGVGRATAHRLAAELAEVVVVDIDESAANTVVQEIVRQGGSATAAVVDVASENDVRGLVEFTRREFGRLDLLHNNAAALGAAVYQRDLTIEDLDLAVWERTIAVNTTGVLLGCKHAVALMRDSGGGSITNTASVAAFHGGDDHASYGASKAAVISITRYVASMYGPDGIRCNSVAPGLVMSETARAVLSDDALAEFAAERALPWAAEPEDVANLVAWLGTDEARCITGQTIVIDSGLLARRPRDIIASWERATDVAP